MTAEIAAGDSKVKAKPYIGARLEESYWKSARVIWLNGDVMIRVKQVVDVLIYSIIVERQNDFDTDLIMIPKHSIHHAEIRITPDMQA